MPHIDTVLYVDTDVIFLGAIEEVWAYFAKFSSLQVGALAPRVGWNFKVPSDNVNYIQMPNGQMIQINSGVSVILNETLNTYYLKHDLCKNHSS